VIHMPSTVVEKWLGPDFELIEAVAHTGNGVVDLWEESPVRLDSNEPNTDEVIDLLFPGNPLLCCGWTRHRFDTRPRKQWYKLQDLQFIVPSRIFGWDNNEKPGVQLNQQFVITQEQLEQIRQLRGVPEPEQLQERKNNEL
jgi:hypothetical protein